MKKRTIALLLAAAMVVGLTACGSKQEAAPAAPAATEEKAEEAAPAEEAAAPAEGKTYKVGFITQSLSNASQAFIWSQWQKFAADYNFEVAVFEEDYDAQNGVAAVGTCIAQGFDAIAMNPTDPSAMIPACIEAKEAGIVIALFSSDLPEGFNNTEYRDFMVGTDDFMCGEVAAKTLMEAFPDGVKMVEVGGQSGHFAQIQRHDGFFATIDSSVEVLDTKDCAAWDTDDAMGIMEDFIVKYGSDIQAVYCHWDLGATGCIKALQAAGLDGVYMIGVDGCSIGYDQVNEGTQSLCIGQNFAQMTKDCFGLLTQIFNGETLENEINYTIVDVVTADTIANFDYPEW